MSRLNEPADPELLAGDPFDRALLAEAHPESWPTPESPERYQLLVIGGGTGGLVTAAIAAGLGARVALVERRWMGGDCLTVGCVPSKAVIRAADAWDAARRAAEFGGPAATGSGDFAAAMERMRSIRARLAPVDGAPRFRDLGVDVWLGDARFAAPDAVLVSGQRLRFRRAVIATGSRPVVPPIPSLTAAGYLTNETVFNLTERPSRLAVIGGGAIGCELAQAFARLGSSVTLLERAGRILPSEDPDASEVIARALRRDGVALHTGVEVTGAERTAGGRRLRWSGGGGDGTVECDEVLLAVGRRANLEELSLDTAGIRAAEGRISVDDRLRTSNRRVFAIGDVASAYRFTHAADALARLVVPNALLGGIGGGRVSRLVIPRCTFTRPEVAHVGIEPAEVARREDQVQTLTVPLAEIDRAVLDGETDGFIRVHLAGRAASREPRSWRLAPAS
jgi:pyruvate/2-oxoglutarate dehydrogenase complex dihydrolipoamide dehydrogenase (E3) component